MRFLVAGLLSILVGAAPPPAFARSGASIIGEWQIIRDSEGLPGTCGNLTFKFTESGDFIRSDGIFEEKEKYRAKPQKSGWLIEMIYISNNGKTNCQGLPADFVRAHTPSSVYIELLNNGRELKFYFPGGNGFMVFRKKGGARF